MEIWLIVPRSRERIRQLTLREIAALRALIDRQREEITADIARDLLRRWRTAAAPAAA